MKLTTRIAYTLLPPHVWVFIRQELPLTKQRLMNRWLPSRRALALEMRRRKGFKLHLGCGRRVTPDWLNVDCFPGPGIDLVWDLRVRLPFADGAASMLYQEHVLEHLAYEEALGLLAECRRVLAPGAPIRLGVPDAGLYFHRYAAGDRAFFDPLVRLAGAADPLDTPAKVVNQMCRMGGHHLFAWDYETLAQALAKAGFKDIQRGAAGESLKPGLCLDDPERAFETLYVEAVAPGAGQG